MTIPISEALQKYMKRVEYYRRLGRLGTPNNCSQPATDSFSMYDGPQCSFTFRIDTVRAREPEGPSVFPCMRGWCFGHRINPVLSPVLQCGCPFKSRPPLYLSKIPDDQLRLLLTDRWVYFVQESGIGAIKIGTAKGVSARVRDMAVSTPHLLSVLAVIEGNRNAEQALHHRFRHARIRGEWFRPVPELLEYIASIKKEAQAVA